MKREIVENWLSKLKEYWFNKDADNAANLFINTDFYQESPYTKPYANFNEIKEGWQNIKKQDIKKIEFNILAIEDTTVIVHWVFERDVVAFDGIYEIKFNENNQCIYFRIWEEKRPC